MRSSADDDGAWFVSRAIGYNYRKDSRAVGNFDSSDSISNYNYRLLFYDILVICYQLSFSEVSGPDVNLIGDAGKKGILAFFQDKQKVLLSFLIIHIDGKFVK